jgi:hypothetical protein
MNNSGFIFIAALLITFKSYGQTKITGSVSDLNDQPVELAIVKLKELNRIAMTNDSGIFHMTLPANIQNKNSDKLTVLVSKEGYKDAIKQLNVSERFIAIKLVSAKATDTIKNAPLFKHGPAVNMDYLQNAIAVKQNKWTSTRKLDEDNAKDIMMYLPDKNEAIGIVCIAGDQEALTFAEQIRNFLTLNGYKKVGEVIRAAIAGPVTGQFLNRDKSGVTITIGHKPADENQ